MSKKSGVAVGDTFITSDFYEFEIFKIEGQNAYARVLRAITIPKINRRVFPQNRGAKYKKLCLYMTHNDESYTPSDGYDSIYGAGGIHDVAKELKKELSLRGIDVVLDETLHIPHNSSAYTRSGVTAKRLKSEEDPDALFDIHRDGVSKKYYYTSQNGEDFSKIRIVVGKSNPDFDKNYQFAQKVFALGASMYPWLFLDIYSGSGHYNQQIKETNLLFEMGTYLIEKESVLNSIPYLVDVVETALYDSYTTEDDEIIVDDNEVPETNDIISGENSSNNGDYDTKEVLDGKIWYKTTIILIIAMGFLIGGGVYLYKKSK